MSNSEFTQGNNVLIEQNVSIGKGTVIGNNVVIYKDTHIGENVRIDDNVIIGKLPLKALTSAITKNEELPPAKIADGVLIGTNAVIYRGSSIDKNCLIADLATIRENVSIGQKTIIGRNVTIENFCTVGSRCKIQTNVYITAHSTLADDVFVSPGVLTSNDNYMARSKERFDKYKGVTIKQGGRIGVGAVILPGKIITEDSMVAGGSLVTKDTPPKKIVLGSPAKPFRDVPTNQLLENQ